MNKKRTSINIIMRNFIVLQIILSIPKCTYLLCIASVYKIQRLDALHVYLVCFLKSNGKINYIISFSVQFLLYVCVCVFSFC